MRCAQERRIKLIELSMRDTQSSAQGNRLHADCNISEQRRGSWEQLAARHGVRPEACAAHIVGLPA